MKRVVNIVVCAFLSLCVTIGNSACRSSEANSGNSLVDSRGNNQYSAPEVSKSPVNKSIEDKNAVDTDLKTSQTKTKDKSLPYIGCWSAGDSSNSVLVVTPNSVQTKNSGKALNYKVIEKNPQDGIFVLELTMQDSSNELDPILRFVFQKKDEFVLEDYSNYSHIQDKGSHGSTRYFRDDCDTIKKLLKMTDR